MFAYLCIRTYNEQFYSLHIGHFWPCAVGCMIVALSFDKRFAVVASWIFAIIGIVAFFSLGANPKWWWGYYGSKPLWRTLAFANGLCLLLFLASHIAKKKWLQNCAIWSFCLCNLLIGFFAVKTRSTFGSDQRYIFVLLAACGCMTFFTHRRAWWQERLFQLDAIREPRKPSRDDVLIEAPEYKFLKFFVPCCWVAVALVLLVALVGFTVTVEIDSGWSSHKVRLFTMLSFISGNSDNAWWQYWLVVLVECIHIGAAALYASSVLATLQSNAAIAEFLQLDGKDQNGCLDSLGWFTKFIAFIIALICVFACIASVNEGVGEAIGLMLIFIIAGGALSIATYGWGSIFCAQAWNEKVAEQTMRSAQDEATLEQAKRDLPELKLAKQERAQREWMRRGTEHIDIRVKNALAYRELAILIGADSMCPDILSTGDDARDKAVLECKDSSFDSADACCTEAKAAYRNACITGADKLARVYADMAKTAFVKGKWQEARSAAEEALDFDSVNADASRIVRKTFWKKGATTANARKSYI